MLKTFVTTSALCLLAGMAYAQPQQGAPGRGANPYLPTEAQWTGMNAKAKAFVQKAVTEAGNDADLKFDEAIFCQADGGASGKARATLGVPAGAPYPAFGAPNPAKVMPPQHMFDNMWWFGNTGVGAWLFTSNDGYILFDTMDNAAEARDIIVGGMKKVGLDPAKIKYVIYGHWHGDHTGGAHYIEQNFHPTMIMGKEDWPLYQKMMDDAAKNVGNRGSRLDDKVAMKMGVVGADGMKIKVGDLNATIYTMTGHTPGSLGMIIPVKWAGKEHPILIITAGSDIKNRSDYVNGYVHIFDAGEKAKVESVMQVHPNTNVNTLARVQYVNDNFDKLKKSGQNPLLYGAEKTRKYIEIVKDCTQARMEILGW